MSDLFVWGRRMESKLVFVERGTFITSVTVPDVTAEQGD